MKLKLIEPLNKLFKDEVRVLGKKLGLPEHMVMRQPFPGPGLAIRIIGSIDPIKIKLVQETDVILQEEIKKAKLDKSIWQYFTVLPNVKTVGVKGDQRSYEHVIVIRAISSIDGMTADYAKIPYSVLDIISNRMVNEIKGINRVVYDITSKPPGTIE
jgi:GMP synthase (glutamine-hydrolysing)